MSTISLESTFHLLSLTSLLKQDQIRRSAVVAVICRKEDLLGKTSAANIWTN